MDQAGTAGGDQTGQNSPGRRPRWWVIALVITVMAGILLLLLNTGRQTQVKELWSQPAYSHWPPQLLGADTIIFGTPNYGGLLAYSPAGEKLWEFQCTGPAIRYITLPDSLIVQSFQVSGQTGTINLVGLDGQSTAYSTVQIDDAIRTGIHAGGRVIYFDHSDNIKVTDTDLNEIWSYPVRQKIRPSLAAGPDGRIYFGVRPDYGDPCYFYCLGRDGELAWRYDTGAEAEAPPVFGAGRIYLATRQGLFAFSAGGEVAWQALASEAICNSPVVIDGNPVCATYHGVVTAFDGTGRQLWQTQVEGLGPDMKFYDVFLATLPDGRLAVLYTSGVAPGLADIMRKGIAVRQGVYRGGLVVLAPADGEVVYSGGLASPVAKAPLVGRDGTIYVICHDRQLHALRIPEKHNE